MKRGLTYLLVCLVMAVASSCSKDEFEYPHEENELVYLGFKSGLTAYSSQNAFMAGLNEVLQKYLDSNQGSTELEVDGVRYELTNLQEYTGGVPNEVWDIYWDKLGENSYAIGSCWGFVQLNLPARGATGTVYVLYTIVSSESYGAEVYYVAVRGNVKPK